jgi:hypothetical protein
MNKAEEKEQENLFEFYNKKGIYLDFKDLGEFKRENAQEKLLLYLKLNLNNSKYEDYKLLNKLELDFPLFFYFPFNVTENKVSTELILNVIDKNFTNDFSTCLLEENSQEILIAYKKNIGFNKIFEDKLSFDKLANEFSNLISLQEKMKGYFPNIKTNENHEEGLDKDNKLNGAWYENEDNSDSEVNLTNRKRINFEKISEENANEKKDALIKMKNLEKIFLPKANEIKILESFSDAVLIETFSIKRKLIKEKNKNIFCFDKTTKDFKLSYVVFILDPQNKKFGFKAEFEIKEQNNDNSNKMSKENLKENVNKNMLMKIENLKENELYIIKIYVKFGDYISSPSDCFCIHTSFGKANSQANVTYNEKTNKRMFFKLKFNESAERHEKNINQFSELTEIEHNVEKYLNENSSIIRDFYISKDKIEFLTNNSDLILLGKVDENSLFKESNEENNFCINENILITEKPFNYIPENFKLNFFKIPIIKAAMGSNFFLALDCSGSVYCWGSNNYGQLGLNLDYSTYIINSPKKLNFDLTNQKENIFIYDIATTKFTCLALGIKNGKQKAFNWGLGIGTDKLNNLEKAEIMNEYALVFKQDNPIENTVIYKSNIPISFDKHINTGTITKIKGGKHNFIIFSKENEKDTGLNSCFFFGFYRNLGFLMDMYSKQILISSNRKDEFILHLNDFFKRNNLSVIGSTNGNEFVIFFIRNLILGKNQLYAFGLNNHGECGLTGKSYYAEPTKIENQLLDNPIKIIEGTDFTFVIVQGEDDNDKNLFRKKLIRIGCDKAIFKNDELIKEIKSSDDLIKKLKLPEVIINSEIVKVDYYLDNLFLIFN